MEIQNRRRPTLNARRLHAALFTPVDVSFLVYYRVVLGAVFLWEAAYFLRDGVVANKFLLPTFLFSYVGFDWVEPWPGNGLYYHFWAMGLLAVLFMVGFAYRLVSVLLVLGFAYVFLLDKFTYLNHFYLILLLGTVMAAMPAHRAGSLDARFGFTTATTHVPSWNLHLLRTLMGLCYFFAGVAKLDADWLAGYPLIRWFEVTPRFAWLRDTLGAETLGLATSWMGLTFDLTIWPMLLWRRTRTGALVTMAVFHLTNAYAWDIGVFPFLSIATTLLFLEPDWPRRFLGSSAPNPPSYKPVWTGRQGAVSVVLALFVGLQTVIPLRPYLYEGNPSWTERGQLFSWRQKLRSKDGALRFIVRNPATGKAMQMDSDQLMDPERARHMAGQPDLIVEFAHHLSRSFTPEGAAPIEVYALGVATLNGRRPQALVDANVDLATKKRTLFAPYDFIVPLEVPLSDQFHFDAEPSTQPGNE